MGNLSAADLQAALRAGLELAEIAELEDFPRQTLAVMHRLIDADMVTYNRMAMGRHEALFAADPDFDTGPAEEVLARYAHENPLIRHFVGTGDTHAHRFSDFLTPAEYHNSAIYSELYRGFEVEHQMAAVVAGAADLFVGIGFNRSGADFSERDREVLDLVAPYVAAAHSRVTWRHLALSQGAKVTVALDASRHITSLDPRAAQWLADVSGQRVCVRQRLPEPIDRWVLLQYRSLTHPHRPSLPSALRVGDVEDGLVVRCVTEVGGAVVMLQRIGSVPGIRQLQSLDLTERQAEILWWLTRGVSTRDVARRLGVSPATVTTHVTHLLRRLEVRSRAEATVIARDALEALG